ncbi:hypothetical protein D9M71_676680 [compost metagenome]
MVAILRFILPLHAWDLDAGNIFCSGSDPASDDGYGPGVEFPGLIHNLDEVRQHVAANLSGVRVGLIATQEFDNGLGRHFGPVGPIPVVVSAITLP